MAEHGVHERICLDHAVLHQRQRQEGIDAAEQHDADRQKEQPGMVQISRMVDYTTLVSLSRNRALAYVTAKILRKFSALMDSTVLGWALYHYLLLEIAKIASFILTVVSANQ